MILRDFKNWIDYKKNYKISWNDLTPHQQSIIIILYTYIAHQTIKMSLMRCIHILKEQQCFKARLNEVMETEFHTL